MENNAGLHAHTNERQGEEGKGGREQGRKNVSPRNVNWKVEKEESNVLLKTHYDKIELFQC